MNIREISETIKELEDGETTFDNCIKLASLYTVMEKFKSDTEYKLNELLPQYRMYTAVKHEVDIGKLSMDDLMFATKSICKSVEEFIKTLFDNTSYNEEKIIIRDMVSELSKL